MISKDKTILLHLSAETIVYISNKLMVMGDTFRKYLKRGGELIKSLGLQTGLNRGNAVVYLHILLLFIYTFKSRLQICYCCILNEL